MITTASWLSISVYLWCITHFNAILIQRLSCHCSVFGWEKKKKQTNGCNVQYVVPWEQRTNKCSAPSRKQQFGVINSMIPPSHFNLVRGYALERGVGGVTWGRGEKGQSCFQSDLLSLAGFRGVLTSSSISVIMSSSGLLQGRGWKGEGKGLISAWGEPPNSCCV